MTIIKKDPIKKPHKNNGIKYNCGTKDKYVSTFVSLIVTHTILKTSYKQCLEKQAAEKKKILINAAFRIDCI